MEKAIYVMVHENGEVTNRRDIESLREAMAKSPDARVRRFPLRRLKAVQRWAEAVQAERVHEFKGYRREPKDFNRF